MSNPWDNDPIVQTPSTGERTPLAATDPLFIQEAAPVEQVSSMPWDNDPVVSNQQEPEASAWEQFKYAFDKAGNITSYAADVIGARAPLLSGRITFDFKDGFQYFSPTEAYGEGFNEATPDQRREMIFANKEKFLEEEYGEGFVAEGVPAFLGAVSKGILDPTSLIPLGQTYKAMAGTSAALGGSWSVLEDVATTGVIDPVKALTVAAASGLLAPATVAGVRALTNAATTRGANRVVAEAETVINRRIAQGYDIDSIPAALEEAGVDIIRLARAQEHLGTKLRIPANADRAQETIRNAVVNDSATSRLYSKSLDKYLGTLSTRLGNISPTIKGRVRRFEYNTLVNTKDKLVSINPFLDTFSKIPKQTQNTVYRMLLNSEFDAAETIMRGTLPQLADNFSTLKGVLEQTANELAESGHVFTKLENYFPRLAKDVNGLLDSLGAQQKGKIEKAISDYAKVKQVSITSLTRDEKAEIIDLALRGYTMGVDGNKPRFLRPRVLNVISEEQMKFYADPAESLHTYIRGAVNNIEKRKFFGRAAQDSAGKFDPDGSIGRLVADELEAGNIPGDKQAELSDLLNARFISGEVPMSSFWGNIRDLGYMGTIANPISALTNLQDMATTAALKGFRNTFKAMFNAKEVKLIDLGLDQVIAQEFRNLSVTANLLNKMFSISGFKAIDNLGKNTAINASLNKARAMSMNAQGVQKLREKWSPVFKENTDAFIQDLKDKQITDDVKFFLFNEIAELQPVTLSEMPQAYLENPNWRILYQLKTFVVKQYDVVRNNIVQEWDAGNKKEAVKNAALLSGYLTTAGVSINTVKNFLLGRETRPEDIPDEAMWSLLGVYGLNKYTNERYLARGDIKGAVVNTLVPATPIIDAAFKLGTELPKDDPQIESTLRPIPVVGSLIYAWFGGGAEKYNERLAEDRE